MNKNKHTDEIFKKRVVECYNTKVYTIKELLNIFKISNGTLYNWINKYNNDTLRRKLKEEKITVIMKCYIRSYVIRKRFIYTKKDKREIQIKEFKNEIKKDSLYNIISIDETSIDTHISNDYGWSPKGKRIETQIRHLRIRYTVISAISNKKVLLNKIIKGSVNGQIFLDFMKELLLIIKPQNSILLDNARIHHSILLKAYMENMPNKMIYNVPYSPEYNPIEKVFSIIKHKLKNGKHTNSNIKKHIINSFKNVTETDLQNFYKKSLNF